MENLILELSHVTKIFGGLKAVDDISIKIREGEFLGVAGPNGSGKSTLFNVLTRLPFGPSAGTIHFQGRRIDQMPPHKIAQLGLIRTFQKDAEFSDLTAFETMMLSACYGNKLSRKAARLVAEEHLEKIGFDPKRSGIPAAELSVYERKQLMIGSALVMKPKVLLLDEPASGLTRPEIKVLDKLLVDINKSGVTILLIEHVLSLLLSVAKRLVVLNQGALLTEGDPQKVIHEKKVVEAYLGGGA